LSEVQEDAVLHHDISHFLPRIVKMTPTFFFL